MIRKKKENYIERACDDAEFEMQQTPETLLIIAAEISLTGSFLAEQDLLSLVCLSMRYCLHLFISRSGSSLPITNYFRHFETSTDMMIKGYFLLGREKDGAVRSKIIFFFSQQFHDTTTIPLLFSMFSQIITHKKGAAVLREYDHTECLFLQLKIDHTHSFPLWVIDPIIMRSLKYPRTPG